MVIYATKLVVDEVNKKIMKIGFGNDAHAKYISFKYTNTETRIGCLHTNNCKNIKGKFEISCNLDANGMVQMKDKSGFVRDYLLDITIKNNTSILLGAEQGSGKYMKNVIIAYSPKMRKHVYD